jgi:hypothetical protein
MSHTVEVTPFRLTEGTITGRGSQRHLTVPGAGLVLADAGHFVSSLDGLLSIAGLHMPAGSEFCAALSA